MSSYDYATKNINGANCVASFIVNPFNDREENSINRIAANEILEGKKDIPLNVLHNCRKQAIFEINEYDLGFHTFCLL